MKKILVPIFLILFIALAFYYLSPKSSPEDLSINSFFECVEAGNGIMKSYPRQCRTADGQLFVEDIGNEMEKNELIRLKNPRPNQIIGSPLSIRGEARGYWYFEADFPVVLINSQGDIIAQGIATAKDEWMTEDFVDFDLTLEFDKQLSASFGKLILQKDNPSGLPEHDDFLEIPIIFE